MFRQTAAISLILLFMLTQYGRQLSYLQCKLENFTVKSNTQTCDCENNQGNDLSKDENKLPAQKTHVHASLDEYYVLNESRYDLTTEDPSLKFANRPESFVYSFNGNIFRPPQS